MIRKVSSLDHNTGLYKAEFKLLDADKKVIDEGIESNGQGYVIFTGLTQQHIITLKPKHRMDIH